MVGGEHREIFMTSHVQILRAPHVTFNRLASSENSHYLWLFWPTSNHYCSKNLLLVICNSLSLLFNLHGHTSNVIRGRSCSTWNNCTKALTGIFTMVVCKFWQQGSCRYGGMVHLQVWEVKGSVGIDRCRFDHPPLNQGLAIGNRFAALQGPDSSSTRNTGPDGITRSSYAEPN